MDRIKIDEKIIEFFIKEPERQFYVRELAIVLFGSFAKGEDAEKSDIDLLVITSAKKELNLDIFDKKLGRKIQLFLFSEKEIEKMKESNKELLNSLINGIILYGFFEVFK